MFYGYKNVGNIKSVNKEFKGIKTPLDLYDVCMHCWSRETCAPRLRPEWSKKNNTVGQCSITSFIVQDIFGGEVYGYELPDGAYHCFNVVDGVTFDLTDAQFNGTNITVDYKKKIKQEREQQFASKEKYERYLLLKNLIKNYKK